MKGKKILSFIFSKLFVKHLGLAVVIGFLIIFILFIWLNLYTHHGRSFAVPDMTGLTLEEVGKLTDKKHLRYVVIDSVFTDQVPRGTVYEQNPRTGFQVKRNRKIFLTMNTVFPDSVPMPDLLGISFRQAQTILENNSLRLGKLRFVPDIAINNVLSQRYNGSEIAAGVPVVKGATIDLDLGMGLSNEKTIPPDLIRLHVKEAETKLYNASLNIGAMTFDETVKTRTDSTNAFIWKQVPEYDIEMPVNLGTPVYLWLTLDSAKLPPPDTISINLDKLDGQENLNF
jgi:hypothetical protein